MNAQKSKDIINRNLDDLAPFFAQKIISALNECHSLGINIHLFEGYRSTYRQDWLYAQGRTREGTIITQAQGGKSLHQYGLAADLCFKKDDDWSWDKRDPWDKVHKIMHKYNFETLSFEKAHIQIDGGMSISKISKIAVDQGLFALWAIAESSLLNK